MIPKGVCHRNRLYSCISILQPMYILYIYLLYIYIYEIIHAFDRIKYIHICIIQYYNAPRPPHLFRSLSKYLPCDSKARRVLRRIVRRSYATRRSVSSTTRKEKREKKETILKKCEILKRGSDNEKTNIYTPLIFI